MKNKKLLIGIISISIILGSFGASASTKQSKDFNENKLDNSTKNPTADWSFLVYLDADNNLEYYGVEDFLQMSSIGSTSNVNIVVQFDRISGYDYRYDDWTSTKRYYVTQNMVPNSANAVMDIGEANMGDPATLINFVNWAKNNYPAANYCLILWDHGSGWRYNQDEFVKNVCDDFSSGDALELFELRGALSQVTGGGTEKIKLIGFDACLMQMIEVAYEVCNYCDYMTGSEETEPVAGWEYDYILDHLTSNPSMNAENLGAVAVNSYNGETLSTLKLSNLNSVAMDVSDLGYILQDNSFKDGIQNAIDDVLSFQDYDFVDLYHFINLIKDNINNAQVDSKAQGIINGINTLVTSEKHKTGYVNAHGVSIYVPYQVYNQNYEDIKFSQDTYWDEFLDWFYNGQSSEPPTEPIITGPNNGIINEDYQFDFYSLDPEGDYISYYIDWGDYTGGEWIGPLQSGLSGTTTHSWTYTGAFVIKAKAVDEHGSESEWSYHTISMPKNKIKNICDIFFIWFYRHFPNLKLYDFRGLF